MAYVVDSSKVVHVRIDDEDNIERDGGSDDIHTMNVVVGTPPARQHPLRGVPSRLPPRVLSGGPQVTTSISAVTAARRRMVMVATATALLCILAVSVVAVLARGSSTPGNTTASGPSDNGPATYTAHTDSKSRSPSVVERTSSLDQDNVKSSTNEPFLSVTSSYEGSSTFVLQKAHWNASFLVYPTVVKHSAPPVAGMERGSPLLDTSENVFHFERSPIDDRFLLLVVENHLTRLRSNADSTDKDELGKVFEDSQWPGYLISVAIFQETEEAFHFATDPFLTHGFFVASTLMTPYFSVMTTASTFFPRNANVQVEYELSDGVVWVNYAIGLLPETLLPERVADDRIGYFMQRYIRYGVDNSDPINATAEGGQYFGADMTIINRRRLERNTTSANQTTTPITYYIDPSVPKRWRQAFADGVMAWSPAFEAIGIQNAISAVLPGDPEWPDDFQIGDLRYNSISVMMSDHTYAYGPSVIDPRSGEILHSDIVFEYGFFDEVVADFDLRPAAKSSMLVSTASSVVDKLAASKRGRHHHRDKAAGRLPPSTLHRRSCSISKNSQRQVDRIMLSMLLGGSQDNSRRRNVPSEIIGRHFADIVMHEVGHTLGLRHNFAGSALISRKQLRDSALTAEQGISSSIMDYIPVNIFSDLTVEEASSHVFYQTTVGAYDKVAIEYGYAEVEDEIAGYRAKSLSDIAKSAPFFLTDDDVDQATNPYAQQFDLSSDPIDYANDLLQLVLLLRNSSIDEWLPDDAPWSNAWLHEQALLHVIHRAISIAQPFLGGVNVTHAHRHISHNTTRLEMYDPEFIAESEQWRAFEVLARIIRADAGLFPAPNQYGNYIQALDWSEDVDCQSPSNEYSCLARRMANLDEAILSIRQDAVMAAMFPAVDAIIAQDVNSPITVPRLLKAVETAAASRPHEPRNQAVLAFFQEIMEILAGDDGEDARLRSYARAFVNSTMSTNSSRSRADLDE